MVLRNDRAFSGNTLLTWRSLGSWMVCFGFLWGLLWGSCPLTSVAQPSRLEGQEVAVYFSKKNFSYSAGYHKLLAHYIQQQDSLNLRAEELKLAASIRLGNDFVQFLNARAGTDSAYFVNARPELGEAFIRSYDGNRLYFSGLRRYMPQSTGLILIIDPLTFRSESRQQVASFSNKIFTFNRITRTGQLTLKLFDAQSGDLLRQIEASTALHPKQGPPTAETEGDPSPARFSELVNQLWWQAMMELLGTG